MAKTIPQSPSYLTFETDKNNYVVGARYPNEYEMKNGILVSTGAFVLDRNIFRYKLVPIAKGKEFGLPQTILKSIQKYPLKGVYMKNWDDESPALFAALLAELMRPETIEKPAALESRQAPARARYSFD